MKKIGVAVLFVACLTLGPTLQSHAIAPAVLEAIRQAATKVIKAIDLQVQRMQNRTIWLQNAQKTLENAMSKLKLDEIAGWVDRHKEQYTVYFDELKKVKAAISNYKKVKEIMEKQVRIVEEYKRAYRLSQLDDHFTPKELAYMLDVYSGIIEESLKTVDQLFLVINAFTTEMTDGNRLSVINGVSGMMDQTLNDLRAFNEENITLSIQRSRNKAELLRVKNLYGKE